MWWRSQCGTQSTRGCVTLDTVDIGENAGAWFPRGPGRRLEKVAAGLYRVRTRGGRAYVAVDGRDVTIIDVGAPGSGPILARALNDLGLTMDDVRQVVLTHAHLDHVGALPEVQAMCSAPIAIHVGDAPEVGAGSLRNPFVHPGIARVTDPIVRILDPGPSRVDIGLVDGDRFPVFGGMQVVHMPGHTPGSAAFLFTERGIVLTGDAVQHRFGELLPPSRTFTRSMDDAIDSIARLATFDFEMIAFSHFRPVRAGGSRRLEEALGRTGCNAA